MSRYIDADALRDKLQEEIDKAIPPFDDVIGSIRCGVRLARNIVEDEPTIDAEPVRHGKWKQLSVMQECFDIVGIKTWGIKYMCESCGFQTIAIEGHFAQYKYCPRCGARMDEE